MREALIANVRARKDSVLHFCQATDVTGTPFFRVPLTFSALLGCLLSDGPAPATRIVSDDHRSIVRDNRRSYERERVEGVC